MSIIPIEKLSDGTGGGKAQGLALLTSFNKKIPLTFVITENDRDAVKALLETFPKGIKLAVRSSAEGEDGANLSFAGQYNSFLNLSAKAEVLEAVDKCFRSIDEQTVSSYKENFNAAGSGMNVLIQEMVDVKASGVLFTADPVNNRFDRINMTIVRGVGEKLMSGEVNGENIGFYKQDKTLPKSEILSGELLEQLVLQAKEIEQSYGKPADLEWAIDNDNTIWWLQLRPVTKLKRVHLNELDSKPLYQNSVYTRGNIGEMMPGPVTPLTLSTFAVAIDVGLQEFYKKVGAIKEVSSEMLFVHSYYNHLFFDMQRLYEIVKHVAIAKKANVDFSVVGATVPGINIEKKRGLYNSALNSLRMVQYINSAPSAGKKLKKLYESFKLNCGDDMVSCYNTISENLPVLNEAYSLHYVTSSQSGGLFSAIINVFSGGKMPSQEHQQKANALFSNIPGIESAEAIKALDKISEAVVRDEKAKVQFVEADVNSALNYLEKTGSKDVTTSWAAFMSRHGHRCVREAEMIEKEWAEDPSPIIESLKAKVNVMMHSPEAGGKENRQHNIEPFVKGLSVVKRAIIKQLLPKARKAVARREQTKAQSVGVQNKFKLAYRHLAQLLLKEELLEEDSHIFFLTHKELGELVNRQNADYWKKVSKERAQLYPEMQKLSFADLCFGIPVPEDDIYNNYATDYESQHEGELVGIPVSQGVATGKVRVVTTLAEAALLQKGEIMVAKFTDVGWTPFYGIVSGLITEIGSPLSHGAVVAREYSLPSIVSLKGATSRLITGQTIHLDAVTGKVEVIEG